MTAKNKKTLSKAYLNQLVNLYSRIIEEGEDLDDLLGLNKTQYNVAMKSKFKSENSYKQHKVKLRAIKKHADVIENEYRRVGKGSLSSQSKKSLREYSEVFFHFDKKPKDKISSGKRLTDKEIKDSLRKTEKIQATKPQTRFMDIAKDIQKKHGLKEKEAIYRTRDLLRVPKKDYKKLNKRDKEILTNYGY